MVLGRTTWEGSVWVCIVGSAWVAETGSVKGAEMGSLVTVGAAREELMSGDAVSD